MSDSTMPDTGHRDAIDLHEVDQLTAGDPNLAASGGDNDHHNHIGDDADDADTDEVALIGAALDRRAD